MRAYITKDLNRDAHKISQAAGISWKLAFGVALRTNSTDVDLLLGNWGRINVDGLARHLWSLYKMYKSKQDPRSYAFYEVASDLFKTLDQVPKNEHFSYSLKEFCLLKVNKSLIQEAVEFLTNPRLAKTKRYDEISSFIKSSQKMTLKTFAKLFRKHHQDTQ